MSRTIETNQKASTAKATVEQTKTKFPQTLRFTTDGQIVKGVFKGSRAMTGKYGEQFVHKINDSEYYGSADLNRKLLLVSEGSDVTVKFNGMKDLENGRKIKDFTVTVEE